MTGGGDIEENPRSLKQTLEDTYHSVLRECIPTDYSAVPTTAQGYYNLFHDHIHIPHLPAFWRPGWLARYIMGPHNLDLLDSFISDLWAGVVVAMTLIPQGLSYAGLANMPVAAGLYCAILPSATYSFFGA